MRPRSLTAGQRCGSGPSPTLEASRTWRAAWNHQSAPVLIVYSFAMHKAVLSICVVAVLVAIGGGCNPGVAGIVFMPALFNPCDYEGTLKIELVGGDRPNWGGTTVWRHREVCTSYRGLELPCATVEVSFSDDEPDTDMKPAGTTIEVYRGTERLRAPSKHRSVGTLDGSCGHWQVDFFDLSGLDPGTYSLVHRRSSGINGEVFCGNEPCPWGTFDGEAALVTKLVIPRPEDLPQLSAEEITKRFEFRLEQIRESCWWIIANAEHEPRDEDAFVDIRIVEDGAKAKPQRPRITGASKLVHSCAARIASYLAFESHPPEPMIARFHIVVSKKPKGYRTFILKTTLVEVFLESRGEAPTARPAEP